MSFVSGSDGQCHGVLLISEMRMAQVKWLAIADVAIDL